MALLNLCIESEISSTLKEFFGYFVHTMILAILGKQIRTKDFYFAGFYE